MELKHERISIKSFFDIPKLSRKYNRVFDLRLVAQEQEVTGRFKTICIRGRGYLSADPETHIVNKSDNHVYLSTVSTEQYGIIKNVNDLDAVMSKNYRAPKDHHAENWKALREYLEGECGRASHVFGYAELRPTHAQLMAVRKSASKQMTAKQPKHKKAASQKTLSSATLMKKTSASRKSKSSKKQAEKKTKVSVDSYVVKEHTEKEYRVKAHTRKMPKKHKK